MHAIKRDTINVAPLAYLTVDDGPTEVTGDLVDALQQLRIPAVMFFIGENISARFDAAVYAALHGVLIGNHSYSHPEFSRLTREEAAAEIDHTEVLIDEVYRAAGAERPVKLFRFPYGDRGGDRASEFQALLQSRQFRPLFAPAIRDVWYRDEGFADVCDVMWTFDVQDWKLNQEVEPLGKMDVVARLSDLCTRMMVNASHRSVEEIVLVHDRPRSIERYPNYLHDLLARMLDKGIVFREPRWLEIETV